MIDGVNSLTINSSYSCTMLLWRRNLGTHGVT